jgi:hypothetical protein
MKWIDNADSTPNVLVLPENPEVGGSVIASTLVQGLSTSQRLGSFFFFDKNSPQKTTSACVRRIIYDLAEQHMVVKDEALRLLEVNPHFLETNDAVQIYDSLIHNPLEKLSNEAVPRGRHPLIVIGCANECGTDRDSDRIALQKIMERWSGLPSSFKLIISSQIGSEPYKDVPTRSFQPMVIEISEPLRRAPTATYQREFTRITRYFVDRVISDEPLDPSLEGNIRSSSVLETFDINLPSYESKKETRELEEDTNSSTPAATADKERFRDSRIDNDALVSHFILSKHDSRLNSRNSLP